MQKITDADSYGLFWERGCRGKKCYHTRKQAKKAKKYMRKKYGHDGSFHEYLCPCCGQYHLGHDKYKGEE